MPLSTLTSMSIGKMQGKFGEPIMPLLQKKGYKLGKTIGEGSYCKVKVAYRTYENGYTRKIACKTIDRKKASQDFVSKFLPREINIIKTIKHPHIVTILDILDVEEQVYIFMDICEKGDLLDFIRSKGPLTEFKAKQYFKQLVSAVNYLHSQDISHRDLKCENILLATKECVKITDFGFSRRCRNEVGQRILSDTFCGSAAYAAPEILQRIIILPPSSGLNTETRRWRQYDPLKRWRNILTLLDNNPRPQGISYNPKMYDVWSLGCILFIMLTATMPFDDSNIKEMLRIQISRKLTFPSHCGQIISAAAKKLVMHLLEPDITRRATIRQVMRNPWLRDVDYHSHFRTPRPASSTN